MYSGQYDGKSVLYNDDECQIIRDDNVLLAYTGTMMTLDNVIPIRDYVLIELFVLPNQMMNSNNNNDNMDSSSNTIATNSGIVIAASVLKDNIPCEGRVIKMGEGRMASMGTCTPSPVQINDIVKFKEYAGNDIIIDGKQYSVVKMVDILCTYIQKNE
jgi:chaperonin GroES